MNDLSQALTELNNAAYAAARVARKTGSEAAPILKALALQTDDLKDGISQNPAPIFSAFGTCQALREIMVRASKLPSDNDALYAAIRLLETAQKAGAI